MIGHTRAHMGGERGRVSTSLHPLAARLEVLAARVAGLSPCRGRPEQFHMDKNEVAHALHELASQLRRAAR